MSKVLSFPVIQPIKVSFDSPAWAAAHFTYEPDEKEPDHYWIIGTFPLGVKSTLGLIRDLETARLLIESLTIAQELYKLKKKRDNDND